ncbi:DNA cytosine methyltransferase [Paenibacillus sp. y28]|uniref:DNA cytosine methyltransferase n=1 Tax=Paenibacillus sp. y28 TaxID=3129110 RepID=UPI00301A6132
MRVADLFAGCGGMSKGFLDAGYTIVAAFEKWDAAVSCYRMNFEHPVYEYDLHEWEKVSEFISTLDIDLIIGGPPCQDFSQAGNRIEGKRAELTLSFAQIVSQVRPAYFVMENVERVHLSSVYKNARKILKAAGYGLSERVVNASYSGVPQNRKRFFCIGGLHKSDGFIDGVLAANLTELPLTVKDYLGDEFNLEYYYRHPRTYERRGIFSVFEPAPTIRGSNRPMPPEYKIHAQDPVRVTTGIRSLTMRERASIQTFPDNFKWLESDTINNQLIGNAVPVKLAYYVAKCLLDYVGGNFNKRDVGFVQWLKDEKGYTGRAAGDVLSRIRRIMRILASNSNEVYEGNTDVISSLKCKEEFQGCTASVKSQLKRAQKLFDEYVVSCKS